MNGPGMYKMYADITVRIVRNNAAAKLCQKRISEGKKKRYKKQLQLLP